MPESSLSCSTFRMIVLPGLITLIPLALRWYPFALKLASLPDTTTPTWPTSTTVLGIRSTVANRRLM